VDGQLEIFAGVFSTLGFVLGFDTNEKTNKPGCWQKGRREVF
jgi:hypothetical protein